MMPNREEKQRRRALVRAIREKERAAAEAAMPLSKPDLKALFEYVDAHLRGHECNYQLRAARGFLILRQLP